MNRHIPPNASSLVWTHTWIHPRWIHTRHVFVMQCHMEWRTFALKYHKPDYAYSTLWVHIFEPIHGHLTCTDAIHTNIVYKTKVTQYWDSKNYWPRSAGVIHSSARVNNCGNISTTHFGHLTCIPCRHIYDASYTSKQIAPSRLHRVWRQRNIHTGPEHSYARHLAFQDA